MPTNPYPTIGWTTQGHDFNYFTKITPTWTTFGQYVPADGYGTSPDVIILIPTSTYQVSFQLEGTGVLQYSFNGQTLHGDMTSGDYSANLIFTNRVISTIWFKYVSGSPTVRIEAYGIR
jgi:hypothetical protein